MSAAVSRYIRMGADSCLGLAREGVNLSLRILELRDKIIRNGFAVLPCQLVLAQYAALSEAQRLQGDAL